MSRRVSRRRSLYWALTLLGACSATSRQPPAHAQSVPAAAEALQDAFTQTAERVSSAVVAIRIEQRRKVGSPFEGFPFGESFGLPSPRHERFQIQRGTGSGVMLRSDGYILTNKHVVENATRLEVVFRDGRKLIGKTVGIDDATDLAVVKVEATGLDTAQFADSTKVRPGQWVVAIGSPFGLDYSVTVGVVSAIGRGGVGMNEIEDYLQTDASINPGNSGGPLVNLHGEVIGINTMIVGGGTGIGFAIPSSIARSVAEQLIASGSVHRAYIGVAFQELTPQLAQQFGVTEGGALVSNVLPGGPADKAGIAAGDVIVSVDGQPIGESRDLLRDIIGKKIGGRVQLGVVRDKKPRTLMLQTVERPHAAARAKNEVDDASAAPASASMAHVGLGLQALTPELAQRLGDSGLQGALVVHVASGSAAERAGLQPGDLIIEADRSVVHNPGDVDAALSDGSALLRVRRRHGASYVVLERD